MANDDKINRRQFIKLSSTGAISFFVLNKFGPLYAEVVSSGRNVSLTSMEFRKGIPTICNLCPARCGIIGFLQNDRLAGIQGNPRHPNSRGKICARGVAGMNIVYDPQRILHPLKREGKRGAGKWKRISWEDALTEITNRLLVIRQTRRDKEFVVQADHQYLQGLGLKFLKAFGQPTIISAESKKAVNKAFSQKITWGEDEEMCDLANTRYMLNFGANPFESHPSFINFSQRLIHAKIHNGAKLITIDPRLSNTAGKSDKWIPIKPGTDAIVALAMANVIMQRNLHDNEFISRWTNVSVGYLREYLSHFTLEEAERQSTIPAHIIEQLAIDFATIKPAIAFSGASISKHINGIQHERSIMLLNAVVGNIDAPGGLCLPRRFNLDYYSTDKSFYDDAANFFTRVHDNKQKVDTFISYNTNPAYEYPETKKVISVLKDTRLIPFSVAITTVMSETAALADIVLPAATYLESWSLNSNPAYDLKPFVALGQPVIPPQGEAKSFDEICIHFAKHLGGDVENAVKYSSIEDFIKESASKVSGFTLSESFKKLKKHGVWQPPFRNSGYKLYINHGFNTPSRKFEIDSLFLKRKGIFSLPQYIPTRAHLELKKNEFILIPFFVNVLTEDLANSKWLSEIKHENYAWINPRTARSLKLQQGATIRLQSSVGELETKIRITAGVHPEVIAICKGLGHWEYGNIAQAKKFKSDDPDTELIWWDDHETRVNPNFLIVTAIDPLGKGQAWNDTIVTVKKA